MKCTLKKPEACFNCPYPDCKSTDNISMKELEIINAFVININSDKKQRKTSDYNRKRHKRKISREWNRIHQKEQTEKRREYHREYMRKYYARKVAANA